MSITFISGAIASTDSVANFSANSVTDTAASCPPPFTDSSLEITTNSAVSANCEPVRHLLFGSLSAVRTTIYHLYTLRYAEPNDWSQPISTGRPNEVMAILTRRVRTH